MENSLKAILIGAGVVITLIVVSIGFILMRSGQSTALNTIGRLDQINVEIAESQYTMYDGIEVRGSEVVNVIRKFKDEYIGIQVITNKNKTGTCYICELTTDNEKIGSIRDSVSISDISEAISETDDNYVNPNGSFLGEIIRDENGTIVGIIFTQQ